MSFLSIPQKRLVLYILLLVIVPHIYVVSRFLGKREALEQLKKEAESLEKMLYRRQQKQAQNTLIAAHYKGEDTRKREEAIETLMRAKFIEGKIEKSSYFQEVPVQLAAPLKINTSDLKQLLSLLEDRAIPPYEQPSLPGLALITDITLERVESDDKQQLLLTLKLLKREFS